MNEAIYLLSKNVIKHRLGFAKNIFFFYSEDTPVVNFFFWLSHFMIFKSMKKNILHLK